MPCHALPCPAQPAMPCPPAGGCLYHTWPPEGTRLRHIRMRVFPPVPFLVHHPFPCEQELYGAERTSILTAALSRLLTAYHQVGARHMRFMAARKG